MPLFDLQLKASLEGVDEIKPQDDYRLMAKVVCTKCHEEHPKPVALVPGEEHEVHGAKNASAHLVIRCQVRLFYPLSYPTYFESFPIDFPSFREMEVEGNGNGNGNGKEEWMRTRMQPRAQE